MYFLQRAWKFVFGQYFKYFNFLIYRDLPSRIALGKGIEGFSSAAGETAFPFAAGQIFALNLAKWQRLFCYYTFFLFCPFACFQLRFLPPFFLCYGTWFSHSLFPLHFSSLCECVGIFFFSCTTISLFALCFRGELISYFRSFNCISPCRPSPSTRLPWAGSKCREVVLAAGSSFVEQATEAKVIWICREEPAMKCHSEGVKRV